MKKKENQSENVMLDDDCEVVYESCPHCDNDLEKFDNLYICTVCDSCFVVDDEGDLVPAEHYDDPNEIWD